MGDWRRYMSFFLVENWQKCYTALYSMHYRTCGVELIHDTHPRYNGNFWWATANYLRELLFNEQGFTWLRNVDDSLSVDLLNGLNITSKQEIFDPSVHLNLHLIGHNFLTTRTFRSTYENHGSNSGFSQIRERPELATSIEGE